MKNSVFDKFCKDCLHFNKGDYCGASRTPDLVTGNEHKKCFIERLDGVGRCGSMGNNFKAKAVKPTITLKPKK